VPGVVRPKVKMNRRRFLLLLTLAGLVGVAGLWRLLCGRGARSRRPTATSAPALSAEAAQVQALLRSKQPEVNFPLMAPTDLADFVPPKIVDKGGPERYPIMHFYLGYKTNPDARIIFAQSVGGFGSVQPFPPDRISGATKQQIKLLGGDAFLVTATLRQTGANLVQLVWNHHGRQYWVESSGVSTERMLQMISSVQPLQ
jgi:hypothetical protein